VAFGMLGFFIPVTIFFQSVLGFSALKPGLPSCHVTGLDVVAPSPAHVGSVWRKYILSPG